MAFTSAKMGLRIWNLLTDLYDHTQLADNWAKVDYHDHSPGKGVQIPTEGIADAAITGPKLATSIDPTGAYTTYKHLRAATATISSGIAANTYGMAETQPSGQAATATVVGVWYFDPADYTVVGRSTKLRVKANLSVLNVTATGVNFVVGLYPVTAIATAALTVGAVVSGSTVTFTAPAGNSLNNGVSGDFDPPAAGYYLFGVATSGASGSGVTCRADLGVHQV